MTLLRTALALLATTAITAACASTAAPAATSAPAAAAATANIDVSGFKFPANVDVAKGTKVTWTNKDTTGHTVSSGTPPTKDGKLDGQLAGGGTFSFTFAEAGTLKYFCAIHNSMTGTITVR